jgi:hypothetical protein
MAPLLPDQPCAHFTKNPAHFFKDYCLDVPCQTFYGMVQCYYHETPLYGIVLSIILNLQFATIAIEIIYMVISQFIEILCPCGLHTTP